MFDSFRRQFYKLPDAIIYYITHKPSNADAYEKLIQTCKYFFAKNPILIFHRLYYIGNKWKTCLDLGCCYDCQLKSRKNINNKKQNKNLQNLQYSVAKLWIIDGFLIFPYYSSNFASTFITKLFRCEKSLNLTEQIIYIDDLVFFPSLKYLFLHKTLVKSKNGSVIPVEKIIQEFPYLNLFVYDDNGIAITKNTVREIIKIPHFHKLSTFKLKNVSESFDIELFYGYLLENKFTKISINFSNTVSEAYTNRLERIVDKILENESPNYKIPYISFPGMNIQKEKILRKRSATFVL